MSFLKAKTCWSSLLMLCLLPLVACAQAPQDNCQVDNEALRAMSSVMVVFTRGDGSNYEVNAKLADTVQSRAAGFQRVCASTIKQTPMLFVFQRPVMPRFHMNNVVAPLQIAFIDDKGGIESIQSMKVYDLTTLDRPLYAARRPIIAALETDPEFFKRHDLSLASKVAWKALSQ